MRAIHLPLVSKMTSLLLKGVLILALLMSVMTTIAHAATSTNTVRYEKIYDGGNVLCGSTLKGKFLCWGNNNELQAELPWNFDLTSMGGVQDFTSSGKTGCAVTGSGRVVCWGSPFNLKDLLNSYEIPQIATSKAIKIVTQYGYRNLLSGCILYSNHEVHCFELLRNSNSPDGIDTHWTQRVTDVLEIYSASRNGAGWYIPEPICYKRSKAGQDTPLEFPYSCMTDGILGEPDLSKIRNDELKDISILYDQIVLHHTDGTLEQVLPDITKFPDHNFPKLDQAVPITKNVKLMGGQCAISMQDELFCLGTPKGEFTYLKIAPFSSEITWISGDANHGCALLKSGALHCWGQGRTGKFANPVLLDSPLDRVGVHSGPTEICLTGPNGALLLCLSSTPYTLGNDPTSLKHPLALDHVKQMSFLSEEDCAVSTLGTLECWGNRTRSILNTMPNGLGPIRSFFSAGDNACVILETGTLKCWGENNSGEISFPDTSTKIESIKMRNGTTCYSEKDRIGLTCIGSEPGYLPDLSYVHEFFGDYSSGCALTTERPWEQDSSTAIIECWDTRYAREDKQAKEFAHFINSKIPTPDRLIHGLGGTCVHGTTGAGWACFSGNYNPPSKYPLNHHFRHLDAQRKIERLEFAPKPYGSFALMITDQDLRVRYEDSGSGLKMLFRWVSPND